MSPYHSNAMEQLTDHQPEHILLRSEPPPNPIQKSVKSEDLHKLSQPEKCAFIRSWIHAGECIIVDFDDVQNLDARIVECTDEWVELEFEISAPSPKERALAPLHLIDVTAKYVRNPKPFHYGRLWLIVHRQRLSGA